MKKIYEAPELFADEYVADTMIASSTFIPKNGQAANNHNCWGDNAPYQINENGDACTG